MQIPRVIRVGVDDTLKTINYVPNFVIAPHPTIQHGFSTWEVHRDGESWFPSHVTTRSTDGSKQHEIKFHSRDDWHKFFDAVVGEGAAWDPNRNDTTFDPRRWARYAPLGSIWITQDGSFRIKFENGMEDESWAGLVRDQPEIDPETLSQLSDDELAKIRDLEDKCACEHMTNVENIRREIARRDRENFHL